VSYYGILAHAEARRRAHAAIDAAQDGAVVTVGPPTRTKEQNAAQWPILAAFADQLLWPVNGHMVKMIDDEWKDVLTAAFRKEQLRLAMGLDGGVVMLGQRTRKFKKGEFSDWLDFLHATAAARGVNLEKETA
jgi:hypothetical protein